MDNLPNETEQENPNRKKRGRPPGTVKMRKKKYAPKSPTQKVRQPSPVGEHMDTNTNKFAPLQRTSSESSISSMNDTNTMLKHNIFSCQQSDSI